jgi:hypothetical protein
MSPPPLDAGLTPHQLTYDIHHPRDWFGMAYLNIVLNSAFQFRHHNHSQVDHGYWASWSTAGDVSR